jgi:dynein heavy chain
VVTLLKAKVDKFHKAVPIVSDLKNPALEQRHWDEITAIIGYSVKENADTTTLGTLIELNVMQYQVRRAQQPNQYHFSDLWFHLLQYFIWSIIISH